MNTQVVLVLAFAVVITPACQMNPEAFQPATIEKLSTAQVQEVKDILSTAVGQQSIVISNNAFANTHILVLEPAARRTPQGTLATGTRITRPPTFHLLSNRRDCVIEDLQTGNRFPMSFDCVPAQR